MASVGSQPFLARKNLVKKQFPIKNFLSPTPFDELWSKAPSFVVPETHKHMTAQTQHLLE